MQQAVSLMLTGIWMLVLINESARMTALPGDEVPGLYRRQNRTAAE